MKNKIFGLVQDELNKSIISSKTLIGGSKASIHKVIFEDKSTALLKYGNSESDALINEANGLTELKKAKSFYIPKVITVNKQYLLTEFLQSGKVNPDGMYNFGVNFAKMHKEVISSHIGFYENNFLGDAAQLNGIKEQCTIWSDFFWKYRLKFQVDWAFKENKVSSRFLERFENFRNVYNQLLLNCDNTPRLLHGDLWSGNYIVNQFGEMSMIDPAVYYGHREADLAMTKLFGGFSNEFYQGYQKEFPLEEGWQQRENFYKLYHILNHYNLFGGGYLVQAEHIIDKYLEK